MFPIKPELRTALEAYSALIQTHEHMWERTRDFWLAMPSKERAIEFACASSVLSDADTSEIPWTTKYTHDDMMEYAWLEEFDRYDVSVAEAYLTLRKPRGTTVNPLIINCAICRVQRSAKWRVSSDRGTDTSIPPGVHGRIMLLEWRRMVSRGTRYMRNRSDQEKRVFAWAMHETLIFLRPFRDGNGRTARLVIQDIRQELGLLPIMFEESQRLVHRERTKFFNRECLIPYLRETYMLSM